MPLVHLDDHGKKTFRRLLSYVFKYKAWFPLIIITYAPIIMFLVFVARGVATAGTVFFMGKLSRQVIYDLRKDLFNKYMVLPTDYYDQNSDGIKNLGRR